MNTVDPTLDTPPETLGTRLRAARKARGLTQQALAERCGTSQAVIQKIENGKSLRPRILEALREKEGG